MGVDLFFVLSGYLIGSQLLRPLSRGERVSLPAFYRKRAYRILPAYLVVLLFYLIWNVRHGSAGMSPLWEFVTFTQNLFYKYGKEYQFDHVWSLCVEEHFYLLLPVMVLWLARRPALWKTATVLAISSARGSRCEAMSWCTICGICHRAALSLWRTTMSASTRRRIRGSMDCWRA